MRLTWQTALICLSLSIEPAHASSVTGTYIGKGGTAAFLLQLIEASDGQLTGRYGQTLLIDGLKLERMNASVKGRSNDGLIVLEIKPPEVLSNTFVLSGSVTDSQLSLKGGGSGGSLNLSLEKAPEDEYQAQIAVLTKLALKNASDSYLNKRLERQTLL